MCLRRACPQLTHDDERGGSWRRKRVRGIQKGCRLSWGKAWGKMKGSGLGSNFKLSKNVWDKLIPSDFNRQHCGLSRERWGEMAQLEALTIMRVGDRGSKVSCSYGKRGWMSDNCSQANTLSPHNSSYLMVLWRLPRESRRRTQVGTCSPQGHSPAKKTTLHQVKHVNI